VKTVANAMDVGAPSNFERMRAMYGDNFEALRCDIAGAAFDDATVVSEDMRRSTAATGTLLDPHAAIAWLGLRDERRSSIPRRWRTAVETPGSHRVFPRQPRIRPSSAKSSRPAIGENDSAPAALAQALTRPRYSERLPVDYPALKSLLLAHSR
jgi:threonine synthase